MIVGLNLALSNIDNQFNKYLGSLKHAVHEKVVSGSSMLGFPLVIADSE